MHRIEERSILRISLPLLPWAFVEQNPRKNECPSSGRDSRYGKSARLAGVEVSRRDLHAALDFTSGECGGRQLRSTEWDTLPLVGRFHETLAVVGNKFNPIVGANGCTGAKQRLGSWMAVSLQQREYCLVNLSASTRAIASAVHSMGEQRHSDRRHRGWDCQSAR